MYVRGLGDMQSATQAAGYGSAAAGSAAGILAATGVIPLTAVPFIGPALAVATLVVTALIKNSGCGQTCIQTSQWANQAADALQKNLDAYRAIPVPRPLASQQLALKNFDSIWAQLVKMCSDPQWGNAGKRCVSDRQRGACTWKNNGQCWDWFIGYRDPIANDTDVVDGSVSSIFGGSSTDTGTSLWPLALIAGLVVAGATL